VFLLRKWVLKNDEDTINERKTLQLSAQHAQNSTEHRLYDDSLEDEDRWH
jgi:hypothetical protein